MVHSYVQHYLSYPKELLRAKKITYHVNRQIFPAQYRARGSLIRNSLDNQNDDEIDYDLAPNFSPPERLQRKHQIRQLQGIWWTSNKKDQLVEINSSYAIFDAPQNIPASPSPHTSSSPAVLYPLGGTDDIVTLRTFKLVSTTPVPTWTSSPTSKVRASNGAAGNASSWERCMNPKKYWKSNKKTTIPGYEQALVSLISGGPIWSASPVDVVRACIKYFQSTNSSLSSDSLPALWRHQSIEAEMIVNFANVSSWSIVKCHYFSPDVCTLCIKICAGNANQFFDFCLSRGENDVGKSGLPPSLLFDSTMDVELCLNGKTWIVDHIRERSCPKSFHSNNVL